MRRSDVPVLAAAGGAFLVWLARRLGVEMALSPVEIETALLGLIPLLVWLFTKEWPNGAGNDKHLPGDTGPDEPVD